MDSLDKDTILVKIAEQFCPQHAQYIKGPESSDKEEQRVVRQFVEALLYEEIVEFSSEDRINFSAEFNHFDGVFDNIYSFNMGGRAFR